MQTQLGRCAVLAFLATALWVATASAESGTPPPCFAPRFIEIFAGSVECPAAQYVVLTTSNQYTAPYSATVRAADHCGESQSLFASLPGELVKAGGTLLVATPAAEALFGIKADVVATGTLSSPNGRVISQCDSSSSETIYGDYPGFISGTPKAPALPLGKALRWIGTGWALGEPEPVGSNGLDGAVGSCPIDAGMPDASWGVGGYVACPSSGGSSPGGGGSNGSSGSSGPSDAGPTTTPGDDGGCNCRVTPHSERDLGLLGLLAALGSVLRRAARRR
ncbi:MAG: hypothetical protein IPI67_00470 [Myxococcales bacterium]|nr:hypothetical protein [Myxococcales bacterium]